MRQSAIDLTMARSLAYPPGGRLGSEEAEGTGAAVPAAGALAGSLPDLIGVRSLSNLTKAASRLRRAALAMLLMRSSADLLAASS